MNRYWLNESYLYEVYADSEEQARELFQKYMEATGTDEQDEFDIEFIDNEINVENAVQQVYTFEESDQTQQDKETP